LTRETSSALEGKVSNSFGNGDIKKEYATENGSSSKVAVKSRMMVTTMRLERYYSSVREEVSPLAPEAIEILENEDYAGFFKACGPNYIRGIRRAQELTAILKFHSSSVETASQFGSGVKLSNWRESSSKFKAASSSLKIKIYGYGLGLTQAGADTLVATTIAEYQSAMKFAFNAMTKNEDSVHIGMVYGMEVVPWVYNTEFQVAAKVGDEPILVPLARSMIPRATLRPNETGAWSNADRAKFRCKDGNFAIDKLGYCCEFEALYKNGDYVDLNEYSDDGNDAVCKPVRELDQAVVKDVMSNNGEFVARLDTAIRYRLNAMGTIEKCISAANSIPNNLLYNVLKSKDAVKYDGAIDVEVSLAQLKMAIDPAGNYDVLKQLGRELDEWIEMYYTPCYAALYGANIGTTPDVEVSFFMAYPWHTHDECMMLSCLTTTLRWNRDTGNGCVPGIMAGALASAYGSDEHCAKDVYSYGATETCKYDKDTVKGVQEESTGCWGNLPATMTSDVSYYMTHFCMPEVTADIIADSSTIAGYYEACRA
jgi:hypothetical protein